MNEAEEPLLEVAGEVGPEASLQRLVRPSLISDPHHGATATQVGSNLRCVASSGLCSLLPLSSCSSI